MFLLVVNTADPKLRPKSQEARFQEHKSDILGLNLDSLRLARGVTPSDRGELQSTLGAPSFVLLQLHDRHRRNRLTTTGFVYHATLLYNLTSKKKFGFRAVFFTQA